MIWPGWCREGAVSPQLRLAMDELEATLARLGQVLDAVLFRDVWRGLAAALNRLFFNVLITEARFSPQVSSHSLVLPHPPHV